MNYDSKRFYFGFTIIELLIVISIVGILAALGLASYVDFNRSQIVSQAAAKIVQDLRLAQSLAANNVKPEDCSTLESYSFILSGNSYEITSDCSTSVMVNSGFVPNNLQLVGFSTVKFKVLSHGVETTGGSSLAVSGFGKTKTIIVGEGGEINVN